MGGLQCICALCQYDSNVEEVIPVIKSKGKEMLAPNINCVDISI